MIWLSKKTTFPQKSKHFLAPQLPESGNLQAWTFITQFSGTHEDIQYSYLPYHTNWPWAIVSSNWLAPAAESLASCLQGTCRVSCRANLQGVSSQQIHTLQDFQILRSPSDHQAGSQDFHKSAICEAGKLMKWALWVWTFPRSAVCEACSDPGDPRNSEQSVPQTGTINLNLIVCHQKTSPALLF